MSSSGYMHKKALKYVTESNNLPGAFFPKNVIFSMSPKIPSGLASLIQDNSLADKDIDFFLQMKQTVFLHTLDLVKTFKTENVIRAIKRCPFMEVLKINFHFFLNEFDKNEMKIIQELNLKELIVFVDEFNYSNKEKFSAALHSIFSTQTENIIIDFIDSNIINYPVNGKIIKTKKNLLALESFIDLEKKFIIDKYTSHQNIKILLGDHETDMKNFFEGYKNLTKNLFISSVNKKVPISFYPDLEIKKIELDGFFECEFGLKNIDDNEDYYISNIYLINLFAKNSKIILNSIIFPNLEDLEIGGLKTNFFSPKKINYSEKPKINYNTSKKVVDTENYDFMLKKKISFSFIFPNIKSLFFVVNQIIFSDDFDLDSPKKLRRFIFNVRDYPEISLLPKKFITFLKTIHDLENILIIEPIK